MNVQWNVGEKLRYPHSKLKERNFPAPGIYSLELVFLIYPLSSKNCRRIIPISWVEMTEIATERCEVDGSKHLIILLL